MGSYCPENGVSFGGEYCKEAGNIGLLCQSGGNTIHLIRDAVNRGVRFSKAVSYGNAAEINETDLLEYLSEDPGTEIILAYVEGVREGKRFFDVLKGTTKHKPVILFKGGRTRAGVKTAASHTGSLAGSDNIWNGLLKQAGAIRVDSLDEMIDAAVGFRFSPLPEGRALGLIGVGGGASVKAADDCMEGGLVMPELEPHIQEKIRSYLPNDAGTFVYNPLDISGQMFSGCFPDIFKILLEYEPIHAILLHVPVGIAWIVDPEIKMGFFSDIVDLVIKAKEKYRKPVSVAFHSLITKDEKCSAMDLLQKCYEGGVPTYLSVRGAAKVLDRMAWYAQYQKGKKYPYLR